MKTIRGFPCSARADAAALVLGSMPGEESLRRGQYYAHPRNSFWEIMGRLFGAGRELGYEERLALLCERGVALWDVTRRCVREGSLDSSIVACTVVPNDFRGLFRRCPGIGAVFFNGKKAEQLYRKMVLPGLPPAARQLAYLAMPSTSPAYASLSVEEKLDRWRAVFDYCGGRSRDQRSASRRK